MDYQQDPTIFEPSEPEGGKGGLPPEYVNLLEVTPEEACRRMRQDWDDSTKDLRNFKAQWDVNVARSRGFTGVYVIKKQDTAEAYIPTGSVPSVSGMNKARRLKRRLRATLLADPPLPETTPSSDTDDDVDRAETATRVLIDVTSEGNLDFVAKLAQAFDVGGDYGSGFIYLYTDPYGGGWVPQTIMARPEAQTADDPLPDVDPNQPTIIDAQGQENPNWLQSEPQTRYVLEDGGLVDDRATEAIKKQWLPKMRGEVLKSSQVRFIPGVVPDLWGAEGLEIGSMMPVSRIRSLFPEEFGKLTDDQLKAITSARPTDWQDLMPAARRDKRNLEREDAYCFVLRRWQSQCPDYPTGAYLISVGDNVLLHRGPWFDETNQAPMDIPVTQVMQYLDENGDNPYGMGCMELLGPGNEVASMLLGSMLDYADMYGNLPFYADYRSQVQPEQLQAGRRMIVKVMPGGEPKVPQVPDYPQMFEKLYLGQISEMDDEAGLAGGANDLKKPDVGSGLHAQTIIEQVAVGLSDLKQNLSRGYTRGCRIILQHIRRDFTVPQKVKWTGDDGAFKFREWTAADLGGTVDVRIQPGSFTQLSPSAKAALAGSYAQIQLSPTGLLSQDELRNIISDNVGGLIGLEDNPHVLRVRRQIDRWRQGPPDGWQAPQPQLDPMTGQPVVAPDPALAAIFTIRPVDNQPDVAKLRAFELGRAMAAVSYDRQPPEWQKGILQAYEQARQAAGIGTVAEQQQAQQQQMQMASDAQKAQQQGQLAQVQAEGQRAATDLRKEQIKADAQVQTASFAAQAEASPKYSINVDAAVGSKPSSVMR